MDRNSWVSMAIWLVVEPGRDSVPTYSQVSWRSNKNCLTWRADTGFRPTLQTNDVLDKLESPHFSSRVGNINAMRSVIYYQYNNILIKTLLHQSCFFPIGPIWWIASNRPLFFYRVDLFKNSSRSLFRYPTLGGLRRWRQIFPRRYTVVLESARSFPNMFAKMRRSTKKRIGYYRDQNNPWWNGRFKVGLNNRASV